MGFRLYTFFRNSAGQRVRTVLNLKGIEYDYVSIDTRPPKEAHLSPEYLKINPLGLIPALDHDGTILTQSMAILEYLEELYPEPSILPGDPAIRAQARAFANTVAGEMHALLNLSIFKFLGTDLALPPQAQADWYKRWAVRGCHALEEMLKDAPDTRFAYGDYPTVADIALVPQYGNLRRMNVDLTPYPRLAEIVERCETLPAFQKAAPEAQPDYEEG